MASLVKSGCEVFCKYFEDAEPGWLDAALVKLLTSRREDEKCSLLLFLAPASPLNSSVSVVSTDQRSRLGQQRQPFTIECHQASFASNRGHQARSGDAGGC